MVSLVPSLPCLCGDKGNVFLFASFVFNNYNFPKASKAEVFVVVFTLVIGLLDATKTQRICLQEGLMPL